MKVITEVTTVIIVCEAAEGCMLANVLSHGAEYREGKGWPEWAQEAHGFAGQVSMASLEAWKHRK